MPFEAPPDAIQAAIKPGEGWISYGWRTFEAWRTKEKKSYRDVAAMLSCSTSNLTDWKQGRIPSATFSARFQALAEVDPKAWTWWARADNATAVAESEEAPSSSEQPIAPAKLGTTREELEDIAARCKALARSPGLSAREQAALEGQRRAAMSELRRLDESAALEDHPDFAMHKGDIIAAIRDVLDKFGIDRAAGLTAFKESMLLHEGNRTRRAA